MKLNEKQKDILSEKLLDLANLIVASIILGQIVATGFLKLLVLLFAAGIVIGIYIYSVRLHK